MDQGLVNCEVKKAIVLEQLLYTLGPSARVWVKVRKPKTALEAGQLADDYSEARKQTAKENRPVEDQSSPASSEKPTQEQLTKGKMTRGHRKRSVTSDKGTDTVTTSPR